MKSHRQLQTISRKPVKSKAKDENVEKVKDEEDHSEEYEEYEDDSEEDEDNEQLGSGKAKAKAKAKSKVKDSKKKRVNKYALLVKEIMQKHNIKKLAAASKYIKEHNLYSKQ